MNKTVIVVGAGLAGLCCARALERLGYCVKLLESSDGVGGRVRTDAYEGFLLDRGFQVLFSAYPAVIRELNLPALNLKQFQPGAMVLKNGKSELITDPRRMPSQLFQTAFSSLFSWRDKFKVLDLTSKIGGLSLDQIASLPDVSMWDYLEGFGFSKQFADNFISPFFGGIFLEKDLSTSVRMFAFVWAMLAQGNTSIPASGMGAITQQIASDLKSDTVLLSCPVEKLIVTNNRVSGLQIQDGEKFEADAVVLATPFDTTAKLAGLDIPLSWRSSTAVYFSLDTPLFNHKLIILDTSPNRVINNIALVSNVAPEYAPHGKHLLCATILGCPEADDDRLFNQTREALIKLFPESADYGWEALKIYRVSNAQFAQNPGVWDVLATIQSPLPGLELAGEYRVSSSIHGALQSGTDAAQRIHASFQAN